MSRVYNFSAGPAAIPDVVLERIRDDIPDWNGTGMSVMEVSHRSKEFVGVAEKAATRCTFSRTNGLRPSARSSSSMTQDVGVTVQPRCSAAST